MVFGHHDVVRAHPALERIARRAVTTTLAIVLAGGATAGSAEQLYDVPAKVRAPTISRSGAGAQYPTVNRYRAGDAVSVDSAVGGWCMINSADAEFVPCSSPVAPRGGWVIGKTVKKSCWPHCGD